MKENFVFAKVIDDEYWAVMLEEIYVQNKALNIYKYNQNTLKVIINSGAILFFFDFSTFDDILIVL